jgi:hypothetical protein
MQARKLDRNPNAAKKHLSINVWDRRKNANYSHSNVRRTGHDSTVTVYKVAPTVVRPKLTPEQQAWSDTYAGSRNVSQRFVNKPRNRKG